MVGLCVGRFSEEAAVLCDRLCLVVTQVILDLIPYENIVVSRALDGDVAFLETLGISSVPACYLIYPNGSRGLVNV